MDIGAMGLDGAFAGPPEVVALKSQQLAEQAGVALLKKSMELQEQVMAQVLQAMGIGVNVDVTA